MNEVPIEILLIEDNPGDVRLTREALKDAHVRNNLSVSMDGDAGMARVRGEGDHAGSPRPDLILLDWNLPGKHGRDVLGELKADPELRRIPVIVLTSSSAERDIIEAYELSANCFCAKPVRLDEFINVVTSIEAFWLTIVKLPSH